ncbi:MAG: tRNA 2-thiocytidine(32) synthetase TtcA [Cytophagales bacterium]|nr:tRNA 2-thiocytidine(32) synthetase TtcA [Cytophagales bacterium]
MPIRKSFNYKLSDEDDRLVHAIEKHVATAVKDFAMIAPDDKVMVCLSGGKDSYTMLDMLLAYQLRAPIKFEIVAVNLDQKQPDYPEHILPEYLQKLNVNYKIIEKDTYTIVKSKIPEGKTMCSLCSRLRRGTLYAAAQEMGATKIALGHHQDDVLETFFLNLFFSGKMEAMPAKFISDDGLNTVIRPLVYVREKYISQYAMLRNFPIIPCNLCGSQPNMQRKVVKNMIKEWENEYPDRVQIMFHALQNIHPSHLYDKALYDFTNLQSSQGQVCN